MFSQGGRRRHQDQIQEMVAGYEKLDPLGKMQIQIGYLQRNLEEQSVIHTSALKWLLLPGGRTSDPVIQIHQKDTFHSNVIDFEESQFVYKQEQYTKSHLGINNAITAIDNLYPFLCSPTGEDIANFLLCCGKALFCAQSMFDEDSNESPALLQSFQQVVTALGYKGDPVENVNSFVQLMISDDEQRPERKFLSDLIRNKARLQEWATEDAVSNSLRRFDEEVERSCTAQIRKSSSEDKFKKIQEMFELGGPMKISKINPYWLFFPKSSDVFTSVVADSSYLRTMKSVRTIRDMVSVRNKTSLGKILKHPSLKKNWNIFSRLTYIMDPFSDETFLEKTSRERNRVKLSHGKDPIFSPDFVSHAVDSILKTETIPLDYAKGLIQLAVAFEQAVAIPDLEAGESVMGVDPPQPQVEDIKVKLMEQVPEIASMQLARMRHDGGSRQNEPKTTDSGMILPILLIGATVFLLSR